MAHHADNDGRTCWICLDDGPDDYGKPLFRECSCRGSAGYVHISCLFSYALRKTKEDYESQPIIKSYKHAMKLREPWEKCPNCEQFDGKGYLSRILASVFVDFVEETYEDNIPYMLEALLLKLESFIKGKGSEGLATGSKMLSLIDQLKEKDPPPSPKGRIISGIEPHVYMNLGIIYNEEANYEESVRCFQTCLDLSKSLGHSPSVAMAERNLAIVKAKLTRTGVKDIIGSEKMLDSSKAVFDEYWRRSKDSTDTIRHGIAYANGLKKTHHGVEAERLLLKLSAMSRRVHGPDHKETINATQSLQKCQRRIVSIHGPGQYLALQYEGCSNQCLLVRGPIIEPEHKQVTFKTKKYVPALGTPVIIEGMQHPNTHLNGKVGEIQSWDKESHCFTVLFEDKSLDPCSIHKKKVRILFELPP